MRGSLARRIFRTTLAVGVVNVAITLVATELIYEDIEETNLDIGLAEEHAFFENQIKEPEVRKWRSALLSVLYVPEGETDVEIPSIFQGRPVPFAAEVDIGPDTYLMSIARTAQPPGILYLAQDISVLEDREDLLQEVGILVFAACMLILSLILARLGTGRIVRPLQNLSRDIAGIEPANVIEPIRTDYADRELEDIARVLNNLLDALDAYVHREKALVSLASHELRTPIAVISGALDVLEQRGSLNPADRRTISRIRQAAAKMHGDVNALLKLAHRSENPTQQSEVILADCIRAVVLELENSAPQHAGRVRYTPPSESPVVEADAALVHMLLRNLVQNAVRHTRGPVQIVLKPGTITISDSGEGLPAHIQARVSERHNANTVPENGLGLFIVGLICERLGWRLQIIRSGPDGTVVDLDYSTHH